MPSHYPPAAIVAPLVHEHFGNCGDSESVVPDPEIIREIIDIAFWASLRREEGQSPTISIAYLPREGAESALTFAQPLPLQPHTLSKVAPAVERPGIHLVVDGTAPGTLEVWGTTRRLPAGSFVLEVVQPGLLVVKRRRREAAGKYANVVVLQGDRITHVSERPPEEMRRQPVIAQLLGVDTARSWSDRANVTVQLATSMRSHGHGGVLLIVPGDSRSWRDSIVSPMTYEASPPFAEISELMAQKAGPGDDLLWRERLRRAVEFVSGLTAVDGATVLNDTYQVLAFGAKIRRNLSADPVSDVMVIDVGGEGDAVVASITDLGGTRHLAAAQFASDQRDAIALVASQDGRFTAFAWSEMENMVWAYRLDALLL